MVVQYYHGYISLDKMIDLCKTTRNGTSAFHIIKAAETLGFKATGLACDRETLIHTKVVLPLIAHVTIDQSYHHYVVIYEIHENKNYFLMADPATDRIKKISFNEFDKLFNQMILVFMPLRLLPQEGSEPSLKKMFFSIIYKYKSEFINFIILSFLFTFFSVATTFYVSYLIDATSVNASYSYILLIFIIFLLFNLFKILSNAFRNTLLIYINQKIDFILSSETFHFILSLPYSYYHNRTVGEIISRMGDMQSIKELLGKLILTVSIDLLLTVTAGVCLFLVSPLLFVIAFICFLLYILLGIFYNPILQKEIDMYQRKKGESSTFMVEALSSFETVKGIHLEKVMYENFQKKQVGMISIFGRIQYKLNHMNLIKEGIESGGYTILLLAGMWQVLDHRLSVGAVFTAAALLPYFTEPIKQFVMNLFQYKEAANALKRISDVFIKEKESGYIYNQIKGKIECKNLTFSYDDTKPIFEKIGFSISKGSKVMLLGKSGSGKSTFLKILMKYYDSREGQVYIDDIDVSMYTKEAIQRDLGYISQNETLFTDTLYNNLTLYRKVDEKHLHRIIRICELETILSKSPLGLFMIIEENGFNLSGGERQKIVLARLLLKSFDLYLIDEGMNQMDLGTERKILKNIYKAYPGKTFVIVSHRVDNLDLFDQVIRFETVNKIFNVRKNENGKYLETKCHIR